MRQVGWVLAVLVVMSCSPSPSDASASGIDLARSPQTVFTTLPFGVGETYTVGSGSSTEAPRPIRITHVEVIHSVGLEVIGVGAFDSEAAGSGVGLVPGWPPVDLPVPILDPRTDDATFRGVPGGLIGMRITAPVSGLRGIRVSWVDSNGRAGGRVWDLAVITCSPSACTSDELADSDLALRRLGLIR